MSKYKSDSENHKLNKLWDSSLKSFNSIKNSKIEKIDVLKYSSTNYKPLITIPLVEDITVNWFGNYELINFPDWALETIHPVAFFRILNQGIDSNQIEIFDGKFHYWFHRLTENSYTFRFVADISIDTVEDYGLTVQLKFLNNRIYDTFQTGF